MSARKASKASNVSQEYLQRAAYHYLGRFASSRRNLERVLERKIRRRHADFAAPGDEETGWIKAIADKCQSLGLVDDREYALQKAGAMHRVGRSLRRIRGELRSRGVAAGHIEAAVTALGRDTDDSDADRAAAVTFARRRRLGPFRGRRTAPGGSARIDAGTRQRRELAAFARAGFAYELARKILSAEDESELEALLGP